MDQTAFHRGHAKKQMGQQELPATAKGKGNLAEPHPPARLSSGSSSTCGPSTTPGWRCSSPPTSCAPSTPPRCAPRSGFSHSTTTTASNTWTPPRSTTCRQVSCFHLFCCFAPPRHYVIGLSFSAISSFKPKVGLIASPSLHCIYPGPTICHTGHIG